MPSIPWLVYAIIGSGMIWVIYRIDNPKLVFFGYIGYAFIIVAMFKILVWFMLGKKRKTVEPKMHKEASPLPVAPRPPEQVLPQPFCKFCKAPLPQTGRFCPHCGGRVRV